MAGADTRTLPLISLERCNGCGWCICACPADALALINGKARIVRPAACDYCGLCEIICPTAAIARPFEIVAVDGARSMDRARSERYRSQR